MIGVGSVLISLFLVLVCYSLTLTAKRADENLLMICEQNQKIEEEKGKQEMESKRDILRVIEKEIKKGSAPVAMQEIPELKGLSETCNRIYKLQDVDVLFQCLLMDQMDWEEEKLYVQFSTIYLLKQTVEN